MVSWSSNRKRGDDMIQKLSPVDFLGNTLIKKQGAVDPSKMTNDQKKLYKACSDFETVLVRQMLDAMQGSTQLFGKGFGGEYFQSMFQDEMAKNVSGHSLGLAEMLYRQLNKTIETK